MLLKTKYSYYDTYTLLEVEGLRIVYVLPEHITVLRDELYDHAFVLFKSPNKPVIDWRKIKNESRTNIHLTAVRRPVNYLNGCALLLPKPHVLERDEVFVQVGTHVARLFSYCLRGKHFVPDHLHDAVLDPNTVAQAVKDQPLVDITLMNCPCREQTARQIPLV